VETGREAGLSAAGCLAGTGLTPADLGDPKLLLEAGQELTVVRNVLQHTRNRPGLGVRTASRVTVGMFGIWGFAMLSSGSTRELIDLAVRFGYGKFSWAFLRPWVDERDDEMHIVYQDEEVPEDVRAFLTERDLTFTAALVPQFFGRALPIRITTKLDASRAEAFAAALPGCTFAFGAERNAQILERRLLEARLPRADPQALRVCERQCELLLAARSHRGGVAAAVRSAMLRRPSQIPSLAEIARERGVDPRTLRRQLTAADTSFRELADEVHETLASELLATGVLTIDEVAGRLGYADASSFTRAYKRWTGTTPGAAARRFA
jgi:AraC-like DNA-binding protein